MYPRHLDVGLYFATDVGANASIVWTKYCIGASNITVDADKLMIFVHGLQDGAVESGYRYLQNENETDTLVRVAMAAGWQVAVFEWTQIADRDIYRFELAMSSLYVSDYYIPMEYLHYNSEGTLQYSRVHLPHSDCIADDPVFVNYNKHDAVVDMFVRNYNALVAELPDAWPVEIRIVGHSLGAQLALIGAYVIAATNSTRKPDRVALLDIVYTDGTKGFLAGDPFSADLADALRGRIKYLVEHGVAVEGYKSSGINECVFARDEESRLYKHAIMVIVRLHEWGNISFSDCYDAVIFKNTKGKFYGLGHKSLVDRITLFADQIYNQHIHIVSYYIYTLVYPPRLCNLYVTCTPPLGNPQYAISAAFPTARLLRLDQVAPRDQRVYKMYDDPSFTNASLTLTPQDDLYYLFGSNRVGQ